MKPTARLSLSLTAAFSVACAVPPAEPEPLDLTVVTEDPAERPLRGVSSEQLARFKEGDGLFGQPFTESDGLGPLYIRASCASCHADGGRGPGVVQKVARPSAFGPTVRPLLAAGARVPVGAGDVEPSKVSRRMPLAVFGRGYLEAVADSEIERVEAEQATRTDGISGRIHRVAFASETNDAQPYHHHRAGDVGLIGRFGWKARLATVDDFAAEALQLDIGITSTLRPVELLNPEGLVDDLHPGPDVDAAHVNALADYVRLLELPRRQGSERGRALFTEVGCATCHVPSLRTRSDYPLPQLAGIDAPVFTDFLLHDMGTSLADGIVEGDASGREWRTPPLIGLRFLPAYLHDGRAKTVEQAISMHAGEGSEANAWVSNYFTLSSADRAELLSFVSGL